MRKRRKNMMMNNSAEIAFLELKLDEDIHRTDAD